MESRTAARLAAAAIVFAALIGGGRYWVRHRAFVPVPSVAVKGMGAPVGVRITVEVINTTTVRGLARRATLVLRDAGFDVVRYAGESTPSDSTRVVARSGHLDWAQAVAKALGGAIVESHPDSSRYLDVTVFLGADWRPPSQPFYP